MLDYLNGGETITPMEMNALFSAFDTKLSTLLGGRSFIIGWNTSNTQQVPAQLFGKTFFFTSGVVVYSPRVPGYVAKVVSVVDPLTALSVNGVGAEPYSHAEFDTAVNSSTPSSYDAVNRIATIPDIDQSNYPAGVTRLSQVSMFEHSLATHTKTIQGPDDNAPERYFLKESSCPVPTKFYSLALADIIIEGITTLDFTGYKKFSCFRFHNVQKEACTVIMDGHTLTIAPFECKSVRRDVDTATEECSNYRSSFRYFQPFEDNDPRIFWFWPTTPGNGTIPQYQAITSAGGMQGNNVSNPAVIYDFINAFTSTRNYFWFNRDVHELCDMYARVSNYTTELGNPGSDQTKLMDLIHHKGSIILARVSKTIDDPRAPGSPPDTVDNGGIKLTSFEEIKFTGEANIVQDFAAYQVKVETDVNGNLTLTNTDASSNVYLAPLSTNLLKNIDRSGLNNWYVLPTLVGIDSAVAIENKVLENSGTDRQDPAGIDSFTLSNKSNYRITQRQQRTTQNQRSYINESNQTVIVTGSPIITLDEQVPVEAQSIVGIHQLSAGDIKSLKWFGHPNRSTQDDSFVSYSTPILTLTPEGLVLTFTEKVVATPVPTISVVPDPTHFPSTWYYNRFDSRYKLVSEDGVFKWQFKHAIRFRQHGFGYGQRGKENAAFLPAHDGRISPSDWENDVFGKSGSDFTTPIEHILEFESVRTLRSIGMRDIGITLGGRFAMIGTRWNLDGLIAFSENYQVFPWFQQNITLLGAGDSDVPRQVGTIRLLSLPLAAEHYNGMAQAVNQLKTGRALDWKCLKFSHGNVIISLDVSDPFRDNFGVLSWQQGFGGRPAPVNALMALNPVDSNSPYYEHFLSSQGIVVRTTLGLPPSWAVFREQWNVAMDVGIDVVTTGVGIAASGTRTYVNSNGPESYTVYSGTVNVEMSVSQRDANVARGFALYPFSMIPFDLNDYSSIKWVSEGDFAQWISSMGFTIPISEPCHLFKLDWFEAPSGFTQYPGYSTTSSYTGEIFASHSALGNGMRLNGIFTSRFQTNGPFQNRKQIGFRLLNEDEADEAEWKYAAALETSTPFRVFNHADRTPGRFYFIPGARLLLTLNPDSFAVGFADWLISQSNNINFSQFLPAENSTVPINGVYISLMNPDAPESWCRFETPLTIEGLRRAENYYIHVNNERRTLFFRIAGSSGVTQKLFSVPISDWGVEKEWWENNGTLRNPAGQTVPRFIPENGTPEIITAAQVTTSIGAEEDESKLVFYDPLQLEVVL